MTVAATLPAASVQAPKQRLTAAQRKERGGTFRVEVGVHFGNGPPGCECDDCATSGGRGHVYRAREANDLPDWTGDLIESAVDLCARFNQEPNSRKFSRVQEAAAPQVVEKLVEKFVDFDEMSLAELRDFAAGEEIELSDGCDTKPKVLAAIRASRKRS